MVMYILYTSHQQNTLDGDVCIIHITPTEHLDGDVYIHTKRTHHITQQNTLDGDVYIIHITQQNTLTEHTTTEHFRW